MLHHRACSATTPSDDEQERQAYADQLRCSASRLQQRRRGSSNSSSRRSSAGQLLLPEVASRRASTGCLGMEVEDGYGVQCAPDRVGFRLEKVPKTLLGSSDTGYQTVEHAIPVIPNEVCVPMTEEALRAVGHVIRRPEDDTGQRIATPPLSPYSVTSQGSSKAAASPRSPLVIGHSGIRLRNSRPEIFTWEDLHKLSAVDHSYRNSPRSPLRDHQEKSLNFSADHARSKSLDFGSDLPTQRTFHPPLSPIRPLNPVLGSRVLGNDRLPILDKGGRWVSDRDSRVSSTPENYSSIGLDAKLKNNQGFRLGSIPKNIHSDRPDSSSQSFTLPKKRTKGFGMSREKSRSIDEVSSVLSNKQGHGMSMKPVPSTNPWKRNPYKLGVCPTPFIKAASAQSCNIEAKTLNPSKDAVFATHQVQHDVLSETSMLDLLQKEMYLQLGERSPQYHSDDLLYDECGPPSESQQSKGMPLNASRDMQIGSVAEPISKGENKKSPPTQINDPNIRYFLPPKQQLTCSRLNQRPQWIVSEELSGYSGPHFQAVKHGDMRQASDIPQHKPTYTPLEDPDVSEVLPISKVCSFGISGSEMHPSHEESAYIGNGHCFKEPEHKHLPSVRDEGSASNIDLSQLRREYASNVNVIPLNSSETSFNLDTEKHLSNPKGCSPLTVSERIKLLENQCHGEPLRGTMSKSVPNLLPEKDSRDLLRSTGAFSKRNTNIARNFTRTIISASKSGSWTRSRRAATFCCREQDTLQQPVTVNLLSQRSDDTMSGPQACFEQASTEHVHISENRPILHMPEVQADYTPVYKHFRSSSHPVTVGGEIVSIPKLSKEDWFSPTSRRTLVHGERSVRGISPLTCVGPDAVDISRGESPTLSVENPPGGNSLHARENVPKQSHSSSATIGRLATVATECAEIIIGDSLNHVKRGALPCADYSPQNTEISGIFSGHVKQVVMKSSLARFGESSTEDRRGLLEPLLTQTHPYVVHVEGPSLSPKLATVKQTPGPSEFPILPPEREQSITETSSSSVCQAVSLPPMVVRASPPPGAAGASPQSSVAIRTRLATLAPRGWRPVVACRVIPRRQQTAEAMLPTLTKSSVSSDDGATLPQVTACIAEAAPSANQSVPDISVPGVAASAERLLGAGEQQHQTRQPALGPSGGPGEEQSLTPPPSVVGGEDTVKVAASSDGSIHCDLREMTLDSMRRDIPTSFSDVFKHDDNFLTDGAGHGDLNMALLPSPSICKLACITQQPQTCVLGSARKCCIDISETLPPVSAVEDSANDNDDTLPPPPPPPPIHGASPYHTSDESAPLPDVLPEPTLSPELESLQKTLPGPLLEPVPEPMRETPPEWVNTVVLTQAETQNCRSEASWEQLPPTHLHSRSLDAAIRPVESVTAVLWEKTRPQSSASDGGLPHCSRSSCNRLRGWSELVGTYHKDSYMAHRRDWKLGHQGRYRRTASPSPPERFQQPPQQTTVSRSLSCAASARPMVAMATVRLRQSAGSDQAFASKGDHRPASAIFSSELLSLGEWEQPPERPGDGFRQYGGAEKESCSLKVVSSGEPPPPRPRHIVCSTGLDGSAGSQHESGREEVTRSRLDANENVEKTQYPASETPQPHRSPEETSERGSSTGDVSVDGPAAATTGDVSSPNHNSSVTAGLHTVLADQVCAVVSGEDSESPAGAELAATDLVPPVPDEVQGASSRETTDRDADPSPSAASGAAGALLQPPLAPKPRRKNAPAVLPPLVVPSTTTGQLWSGGDTPCEHVTNGRMSLPVLTSPQNVNGVMRLKGTRPSARDLLDPRQLPEAMQSQWNGVTASYQGGGDTSSGSLLPERRWSTLCLPYSEAGGRRGGNSPSRPSSPRPDVAHSSPQSPVHSPVTSNPGAVLPRRDGPLQPEDGLQDQEGCQAGQGDLCWRLAAELSLLREDQRALEEEAAENAARGATVTARVIQLLRPSEAERYRVSIEQVGTITRLLLCLEGRLARTQEALPSLPDHGDDEEAQLVSRREKLSAQLEEARHLQRGVERRRHQVELCLQRYLSSDEMDHYTAFVRAKVRLIRQLRHVEQEIRSREQQLAGLTGVLGWT